MAVAAVAGVVLAGGAHAYAQPSVAELERQIDAAWNKLEPIIEKHNEARTRLAANRAKSAQLAQQIQPLALQVDLAMSRVGALAVHYYKGGNNASAINALLTTGSPTTLAEQLELLEQVAKLEKDQISNVAQMKAQYEAAKQPLDALVAQQAAAEADLAAQEKQIDAEIKRLQDLRLAAYGSTGGIGELRPAPCPLTYPGGPAGIAVKYACAQIGKQYVYGTAGPDTFDCSGLTMAAWQRAGVSLPHNAAAQKWAVASVSRSALRPGDLVFYYSDVHHVGMYVGGDWIVHASMAGVPIQMRKIDNAPVVGYGRPG